MAKKNLKPVRSLKELGELVGFDPEYQTIAIMAAKNLGGKPGSWRAAIGFLEACAVEAGEGRVMQAINFCIASSKIHS